MSGAAAARRTLGWLETRIATRRGVVAVFALGLAAYALQSIGLPAVPGRDFRTYLTFYVQMWDSDSVLPMSMLFRTPVAPLLLGGALDVVGGYGAQVLMGLLYAGSIAAWTSTASVFGARAALVTAAALLVYPSYGILFHMPASDAVCAAAFAAFGLALARAWVEPSLARFALVGVTVAVAGLTRPGYQVLAVAAFVPLALPLAWRARLAYATACAAVVAIALGGWTVNNGLRYDDYTVARGGGAFFPFYRALTSDHIASPRNGEASRELARLVSEHLLTEAPYRPYGVTLDEFFEQGSPRMFEDAVVLSDRHRGWDSDYALLRDAGLEAVRAEPWRYARGVLSTVVDELWSPLHVTLLPNPEDVPPTTRETIAAAATQPPSLPPPKGGELVPSARNGFFTTTPDGSIREVWTSANEHHLVFADPAAKREYDAVGARAIALSHGIPPYPGSEWLTQQYSRSSKLFPPPLLWLAVGAVALAVRRPARSELALALAAAALLVVGFQALAVYAIVEFAVPVAPALVVLGAAGIFGAGRR